MEKDILDLPLQRQKRTATIQASIRQVCNLGQYESVEARSSIEVEVEFSGKMDLEAKVNGLHEEVQSLNQAALQKAVDAAMAKRKPVQ